MYIYISYNPIPLIHPTKHPPRNHGFIGDFHMFGTKKRRCLIIIMNERDGMMFFYLNGDSTPAATCSVTLQGNDPLFFPVELNAQSLLLPSLSTAKPWGRLEDVDHGGCSKTIKYHALILGGCAQDSRTKCKIRWRRNYWLQDPIFRPKNMNF